MQYGEGIDVTDIVRMTFESTDVQSHRQLRDRVVTTYSVRREYGLRRLQREYIGSAHSADTVRMSCSFANTVWTSAVFRRIYSPPYLKCASFDCGNKFEEHSEKENVANTRREETNTTHATVSAMATGGCSYAPLRTTWRTEKKRKKTEWEWQQDKEPDDREHNGSDSGCLEDQCMASMRIHRQHEY